MIIELKVKNGEKNKIFTVNFPQLSNSAEIPKKIMIEYEKDTERCETFTSYGVLSAMEFNCKHVSTEHVNVDVSGEKCKSELEKEPDTTTMVSENEKSKNPTDDKDDDYTILDPEDKKGYVT